MTSSMLERVIRAVSAAEARATVVAGRIISRREARLVEEEGSQSRWMQNSRISRSPCQKRGIDTPISAVDMEMLSMAE